MDSKTQHWNDVYGRRAPTDVSWFQPHATTSLEMIAACTLAPTSPLLDVGAGASRLVDDLLAQGYRDVTLLDIAESAFVDVRRRLGAGDADAVHYVVADVTEWTPTRPFALWHDRAVFHFLVEGEARAAYRRALARALPAGAHAILSTFDLTGPERCSGLPVRRYSAESLAHEFEEVLRPLEVRHETHHTPTGSNQAFVFVRFERL